MTFTIAEQIDCIERELRFRKFVYPRRVRDGKMSQAEADRQIALMQAVAATPPAPATKCASCGFEWTEDTIWCPKCTANKSTGGL